MLDALDAEATMTEILAWLQQTAPGARLSSDSRMIVPGDVFFAYPGDAADGRNYIEHAIKNGALAVLHEADGWQWNDALAIPHLAVSGLKQIAGRVASMLYGQPDSAMFTVAVTGTNGKTSCTQWLGHALSSLGLPTVVIGTLGVGVFKRGVHGGFKGTGYTTPDAVLLQNKLVEARDAGAKAMAIEASSIGLDQGRLNGIHFDVALFTNFTRDHLDYHGDMAGYEASKTMLFDWTGLRHAVVNLDDAMGLRLLQRMQSTAPDIKIIGYTLSGQASDPVPALRASAIHSSHAGTSFQLDSPFGSARVKTQLVGQFNVSNVLGILGVLLSYGAAWQAAIHAVEALSAVPGRMQQLGGQDAPLVVIDYAHTPDALEKTLASLRQVAQQRSGALWCVFGCGGDRDPGKRPQMGAVSLTADHVVVTSDNPRGETPSSIITQIVRGMGAAQRAPELIEDRAAAILFAIKHAAKQDVILLAGKGHETTQEILGRKLPFLDADHAALALAARASMKGHA